MTSWGTLREALRDGKTEARVTLSSASGDGFVAVGAVAGLRGEITAVDGRCFVATVKDGRIQTRETTTAEATILFGAKVAKWHAVPITADLDLSDLDEFLASTAKQLGLTTRPFPFVIEGELADVHFHVLQGECPIRARILDVEMQHPPAEETLQATRGRLVGIFAPDGGGKITHHGSATHVHYLHAAGAAPRTGHCEDATARKGCMLRVPAGW